MMHLQHDLKYHLIKFLNLVFELFDLNSCLKNYYYNLQTYNIILNVSLFTKNQCLMLDYLIFFKIT